MNPNYATSAIGPDGALLGFAAIADHQHGFWRVDDDLPEFFNWPQRMLMQISGKAYCKLRWRSSQEDTLLLDGVYVSEGGLQRGVGEPLLKRTIQQARDIGAPKMEVYVEEPNAPLRAIYEAHGFRNQNPWAQYGIRRVDRVRPHTHLVIELS